MTLNVPPSTVAMSLVNVLTKTGPAPRSGLSELLAGMKYPVARELVEASVDQAIERGLLDQTGEMVASKLPGGWVVTDRSRAGDGWDNWSARHVSGASRSVEELLQGEFV
jgi:hypothetical protein